MWGVTQLHHRSMARVHCPGSWSVRVLWYVSLGCQKFRLRTLLLNRSPCLIVRRFGLVASGWVLAPALALVLVFALFHPLTPLIPLPIRCLVPSLELELLARVFLV